MWPRSIPASFRSIRGAPTANGVLASMPSRRSIAGLWATGVSGDGPAAGAAPRMSYTAAGYANGGSYQFHFPDGNASIARLLVRDLIPPRAGKQRGRHRHRRGRLQPARSRWISASHSAQQHRGSRAEPGRPVGRSGSGSRLCKWGPGLQRARRPLRSCLLEYGDPLSVPRLARKTERSTALPGEGSFDIHQRCHPQLDLVAKAWRA